MTDGGWLPESEIYKEGLQKRADCIHFQILNLITPAKFLLPYKARYSQVSGIGKWTCWEAVTLPDTRTHPLPPITLPHSLALSVLQAWLTCLCRVGQCWQLQALCEVACSPALEASHCPVARQPPTRIVIQQDE